jgi:membrane-associated phospholipid phosphatase
MRRVALSYASSAWSSARLRVVGALLLLGGFLVLGATYSHELLRRLDAVVFSLERHSPLVEPLMVAVSRMTDEWPVILTAAAVAAGLLATRQAHLAVFLGLAVIVGQVANSVLQDLYDRQRPAIPYEPSFDVSTELWWGIAALLIVAALATSWRWAAVTAAALALVIWTIDRATEALFFDATDSFPSGHAMAATSLFAALAMVAWRTRWRLPALVLGATSVLAVGLSRVYLGAHYPTDVVAGSAVALAFVLVLSVVPSLDPLREPLGPYRPLVGGEDPNVR